MRWLALLPLLACRQIDTESHSYELFGDVSEVALVLGQGTVEIVGVDDEDAYPLSVDAEMGFEKLRPWARYDVVDGVARFELLCRDTDVVCSADLRLDLPRWMPVSVDIGIGGIAAGGMDAPLELNTGAGAIVLDDLTGDVFGRSGTGPIQGRALAVKNLDLVAAMGDVEIDVHPSDPLGLEGGMMGQGWSKTVVDGSRRPQSVRAVAETGIVRLVVPQGYYDIDAEAGLGLVELLRVWHDERSPNAISVMSPEGVIGIEGVLFDQ